MPVSIITLTRQDQKRHFPCQIKTIEAGLEVVRSIALTGNTLLRVDLLEENNVLPLPVETLDGLLMREALVKLQQEWEEVLRSH